MKTLSTLFLIGCIGLSKLLGQSFESTILTKNQFIPKLQFFMIMMEMEIWI